MENHSRRMAHGDPRPARTPSHEIIDRLFVRVFLRGSSTTPFVKVLVGYKSV